MLQLCGLECVDTVVTDSAAPMELVEQLRAKGIEVVVAAG
jgi:DeoR/GlpR family transcriptional regulator of sugar metabolism